MAFEKGKSGNPKGRPPAGEAYVELLRKALKEQGRRHRCPVMTRIAKLFYSDDAAALKILKTLVPELKVIDAKIDVDSPFRLILEYKPTVAGSKVGDKADKQSIDSHNDSNSKPTHPGSRSPAGNSTSSATGQGLPAKTDSPDTGDTIDRGHS